MKTEKKMYRVEKFIPPECPKCRAVFKNEGKDYVRLLGDIVDGEKRVRETNGYTIKICQHCKNYTACMELDSYQVSDLAHAERLCAEEGYVNLLTVTAVGTHAQDHHVVNQNLPATRVYGIKCDEEPHNL